MSHIKQFDHVGITVADLDSATAFFADLGLEVEGRTFLEGDFVDDGHRHPGLADRDRRARPPGGGTGVELASFVRPDHEPGSPAAMANELGLRSICFEVEDLQAAVDGLAANGIRTGRRDRSARGHLADGPCARAGGNRRLADRADRLTPSGCPLPLCHCRL